jgi:ribosomal protein L37E
VTTPRKCKKCGGDTFRVQPTDPSHKRIRLVCMQCGWKGWDDTKKVQP